MGELSQRVGEFENATPVVSHAAHAEYLENLERLLRAAAIMFGQDGQIAGAWLRKRKPKKPHFYVIQLRQRISFGRRTKAHGRHGAKALAKAADKIADLARFHQKFVDMEKTAGTHEFARQTEQDHD